MGGLIARKMYLLNALHTFSREPYEILVSIATPYQGALLGQIAAYLGISEKLAEDLAPKSSFLRNLQIDWETVGSRPLTDCYWSAGDKVVEKESAIAQCEFSLALSMWDHTDLVKPTVPDDERYIMPMARIKELLTTNTIEQ
jgi:hypothetical protein